jgi:hypothetical protein
MQVWSRKGEELRWADRGTKEEEKKEGPNSI